jgi:hypothetical protein
MLGDSAVAPALVQIVGVTFAVEQVIGRRLKALG